MSFIRNMNTKRGKIRAAVLAAAFLFSLVSLFTGGEVVLAEKASGPVQYVDENGKTQECSDYRTIDDPSGYSGSAFEGWWYVVDTSYTFETRMEVVGDVYIILTDGCTLTAKKGINVGLLGNLHIYDQPKNTGKLTTGKSIDSNCAGIGGNSGKGCGNIEINGGKVIAYGGENAAGIGSGSKAGTGNASITINGGEVTAYGGKNGAGIGGGSDVNVKKDKSLTGGTITISGGDVSAVTYGPGFGREELDYGGAGIGSGRYSPGCNITISGGRIYAVGQEPASGEAETTAESPSVTGTAFSGNCIAVIIGTVLIAAIVIIVILRKYRK